MVMKTVVWFVKITQSLLYFHFCLSIPLRPWRSLVLAKSSFALSDVLLWNRVSNIIQINLY